MWDGVPWYVEGGALHSEATLRLLAFAAFGSNEGVVGSKDLTVRALAQPDASVQVLPGACAVLNRAEGASYQAYAGRLPVPDTIPIASTGSQPRSDLVIARVENPFPPGEAWALPTDVEAGPYIFTRVISGVPPTTVARDLATLAPRDSAIVLARIDLPPGTTAVTQEMIKDLRSIANPRHERIQKTATLSAATLLGYSDGSWQNWPGEVTSWNLDIPRWATHAKVQVTLAGVRMAGGAVAGSMHLILGTAPGAPIPIGDDQSAAVRRRTVVLSTEFPIADELRSTTQALTVQTKIAAAGGDVQVDTLTWITLDIEFSEAPDIEGA
ncbi:hypothetical protein ABTY59_31775 [Streptomyces sp. NPDC096079]|uniref:hypothetical protein n=1 Tax=Streptomyces sp. NPDC096079 TaxID=3155820 RepID=UPI00331818C8